MSLGSCHHYNCIFRKTFFKAPHFATFRFGTCLTNPRATPFILQGLPARLAEPFMLPERDDADKGTAVLKEGGPAEKCWVPSSPNKLQFHWKEGSNLFSLMWMEVGLGKPPAASNWEYKLIINNSDLFAVNFWLPVKHCKCAVNWLISLEWSHAGDAPKNLFFWTSRNISPDAHMWSHVTGRITPFWH